MSDDAGPVPGASAGLMDALARAPSPGSAPLREDEVQNAVNFLTHPKVVVRRFTAHCALPSPSRAPWQRH